MDDPNATYKTAFAELQAKLGRVPTSSDSEWLAIGNEYSRSYEEEKRGRDEPTSNSRRDVRPSPREGVIADGARNGHADSGNKALPESINARLGAVAGARESDESPSLPLSGSRAAANISRAGSEPPAGSSSPGISEPAITGTRGPAGGIMAACVVCGRAWERPARRGRPSAMCEECR